MTTVTASPMGTTGMTVSRLGYGTLELGGTGTRANRHIDPKVASQVLNGVLDAGINFIDTSPDYGSAEDLIGRFLSHRREEYLLASKCGCPVGSLSLLPPPLDGPRKHVYTRKNIRAGVEQSLKRMRTDYLDLAQIHEGPTRQVLDEENSIEELLTLRDEGKVRFIGMSSTLPNLSDHLQMAVFDAFQLPYSALQPEHGDAIGRIAAAGAGVIVRGGIAQGSISKLPKDAPPHREEQIRIHRSLWEKANMDELLEGMPRMEFMLRFTLSHHGVSTAIVGTANPDHLANNLRAADRGALPAELYEEANERLSQVRS